AVTMNGKVVSLDVIVSLSGQSAVSDAPISGQLSLQGGSLDVGSSSKVSSSSLDMHCTVSFVDASTGTSVGSSLQQDLQVTLQQQGLSITRLADGSGRIVLGGDAGGVSPFTFSSSGGELVLRMVCQTGEMPVRESGLMCFPEGSAVVTSSSSH